MPETDPARAADRAVAAGVPSYPSRSSRTRTATVADQPKGFRQPCRKDTAFRYKGRDVDPEKVGRELRVRTVLTGIVRRRGKDLDVRVDLADTSDGAEIWGETYGLSTTDARAVQERVAEALRRELAGEKGLSLAKSPTRDAAAYQLYLRGRYFWNKRTEADIRKAIGLFQQATDRDPTY